jgi:hypothetical protein
MPVSQTDQAFIYGGVTNVSMSEDQFDLGHGLRIVRTYAHLFSTNMMAFSPPGGLLGIHGGPWKAAKGGFAYDISIELCVPTNQPLPGALMAQDAIWLIAALLRVSKYPYLMVPVISTHSFGAVAQSTEEPNLEPFETVPRIMRAPEENPPVLDADSLGWLYDVWPNTAELIRKNEQFHTAFRAFDQSTLRGRTSSSLLMVWGALEQLFAPSTAELRYRVSSNIASYLNPPGEQRLKAYREILKLYSDRSTAAHTAKIIDQSALIQSFVLMRNSLVQMIDRNHVPTQTELEEMIFVPQIT